MKEFPLRKSIKVHGEEVVNLSLREPEPDDAEKVGLLPYRVGADEMPVPDMKAVMKYLVLLASIPPSSVKQIHIADLNALAWQVVGFFLSSEPEMSTS